MYVHVCTSLHIRMYVHVFRIVIAVWIFVGMFSDILFGPFDFSLLLLHGVCEASADSCRDCCLSGFAGAVCALRTASSFHGSYAGMPLGATVGSPKSHKINYFD